jgi:hypothetical protein
MVPATEKELPVITSISVQAKKEGNANASRDVTHAARFRWVDRNTLDVILVTDGQLKKGQLTPPTRGWEMEVSDALLMRTDDGARKASPGKLLEEGAYELTVTPMIGNKALCTVKMPIRIEVLTGH